MPSRLNNQPAMPAVIESRVLHSVYFQPISFGDSITRMDEEETSVEFVKNSSVAIERENYLAKSKLIAIGTGRKSLLIES